MNFVENIIRDTKQYENIINYLSSHNSIYTYVFLANWTEMCYLVVLVKYTWCHGKILVFGQVMGNFGKSKFHLQYFLCEKSS